MTGFVIHPADGTKVPVDNKGGTVRVTVGSESTTLTTAEARQFADAIDRGVRLAAK